MKRVLIAVLVSIPSFAQEVTTHRPLKREGLFIEPALGASFLSVNGPGLFAPTLSVLPELRVGLLRDPLGFGSTLGLGFTGAIPGGLFPQLFVGGNGRYFFS